MYCLCLCVRAYVYIDARAGGNAKQKVQLTGISARSFEKKGKQDLLIDGVAPVVSVQREKVSV